MSQSKPASPVKGTLGNQPVALFGIYSPITPATAPPTKRQREVRAKQSRRHPKFQSTTLPLEDRDCVLRTRKRALEAQKSHKLRTGSLHAKYQAQLGPDDGEVHEHLRGALLDNIGIAAAEGRTYFVAGDFNSDLTPASDKHKYMEVMDGVQMKNSETAEQQTRCTYRSGHRRTRIDHAFHSKGAEVKQCRLIRPLHFNNGHAGLLVTYRVDRGPPSRWQFVLRQITKSYKDFGDPVVVADVTKKFATLERDMTIPCAQRLDKLTSQSVGLVHPCHRRPARHRICRDWSPDSVEIGRAHG